MVGTFRQIIRDMPDAFHVKDGNHMVPTPNANLNMDALGMTLKELKNRHAHRVVGVVEWEQHTIPFALPGDSGSLVYAMNNSAIVPLGLHIGRTNGYNRPKSTNGYRLFLALECFLFEGEVSSGMQGWISSTSLYFVHLQIVSAIINYFLLLLQYLFYPHV